jgi:hypothetical protein
MPDSGSFLGMSDLKLAAVPRNTPAASDVGSSHENIKLRVKTAVILTLPDPNITTRGYLINVYNRARLQSR